MARLIVERLLFRISSGEEVLNDWLESVTNLELRFEPCNQLSRSALNQVPAPGGPRILSESITTSLECGQIFASSEDSFHS